VDVIFVSTNQQRRTFTIAKDAAQIFEQLTFDRFSDQWLAVLCAEDEINKDRR
jgi:hypothetical protein